jgi:hypothetical protein
MKNTNRLGIASVTLSIIGVLGYLATIFLWTRPGSNYTPSAALLPMTSFFCSVGAVVTGALGMRPVRTSNLIGLILGAGLVVISFAGIILVIFVGL